MQTSPLKKVFSPQVITLLFLGISAGIPIVLIFSSLSIWLREAGVARSAVTFFSWAALGYSFKFVWAPLIDKLPVPLLTRLLGKRRAWILVSQGMIISAISWMAFTNPANNSSLSLMAMAAVLLGFSSATQDIVIDAYRIEIGDARLQALMSSSYIAGYRIGMLIAGAGALFLADIFGSNMNRYNYAAWQMSYLIIAGTMLIGVVTTLMMPEPKHPEQKETHYGTKDYFGFFTLFLIAVSCFVASFLVSADWVKDIKISLTEVLQYKHVASFLVETTRLFLAVGFTFIVAKAVMTTPLVNKRMVSATYVQPFSEFFNRYPVKVALLILALVGFYRISDIVLGVISNVFYQDLGFTKTQIASVVKTFGLFMTIAGGFLGGFITLRIGVIKTLMLGAILTIATNLMFVLLANTGPDIKILYLVISADNLTAGLASAAFIAFLSAITNIKFTAMQYAIFSSLMTLLPKLLGGFSGTIVDSFGYVNFFIFASVIGVPVLVLVYLVNKHIDLKDEFSLK